MSDSNGRNGKAIGPDARLLKLEAQVFKMAEWLIIERRIADAAGDGDRVREINALLTGSAGDSYLADLISERDKLRDIRNNFLAECDSIHGYSITPDATWRRIVEKTERRLRAL